MSWLKSVNSNYYSLFLLAAVLTFGIAGPTFVQLVKADCNDPDTDPDIDRDHDGAPDCEDVCPLDSAKAYSDGYCGCGAPETNSDDDSLPDCVDQCYLNGLKYEAGQCGCEFADTGTDENGVPISCSKMPDDAYTRISVKSKDGNKRTQPSVTFSIGTYQGATCSWRIDRLVGPKYKKIAAGSTCQGTVNLALEKRATGTFRILGKVVSADQTTSATPTSKGFYASRK